MEFRGIVNIDAKGEVVCFCTMEEALRGECACQLRDNCPEAMISIEVIPNSRPSDRGVKRVEHKNDQIVKSVEKIKEGLSRLEQAAKKTKFRI